MSRTGRDLTFFLTGIATGALLGLLYAPEKGQITRDRLTYRLSRYRQQLEQLVQELLNSAEWPENLQRSEGERVVTEAREKAERLLEDVDRLMAQIKRQQGA